jgi:hypothetical protein
MGMIDKVFCVQRAYDVFLEREDRESYDALVSHLNSQFDGVVTLDEAAEIMRTVHLDGTSFWENVRRAENEATIPLMVMRRLYHYEEVNVSVIARSSPEFERFAETHLRVLLPG